MPLKSHTRHIESRVVESLQPYPLQAEMFGDLSEQELAELAADIKKNGLLQPIEILPCGTIIAGHQRLRAVKMLKWQSVDCWVRHDLVGQGEAVIEIRFIEDNVHRRQLTKLGSARAYLRLKELQQPESDDSETARGDRRDVLASRFNKSGRTLDRLAKMLEAPAPVQQAYEADQLTGQQVLAVVRLDPDLQDAIAERLQDGEDPAAVVNEFLQRPAQTPRAAERAFRRLMTDLRAARSKLKTSIDEVASAQPKNDLELLRAFRDTIIPRLIEKVEHDEAEANDLSYLDDLLPDPSGQNDRADDQQLPQESPGARKNKHGGKAKRLQTKEALTAIQGILRKS